MRLEFEVELADAPGQLQRVLTVIADHGGNVLSVLHRHEKEVDGRLPVLFGLEIEESDFVALMADITAKHRLLRVNREGGPRRAAVLLSGHVFQANIQQLLEPVWASGATVGRVDARINRHDSPSAVLIQLSADETGALTAGLAALRTAAGEAGLEVIETIGGAA
ncbi:MAG: ACT domain-containing protein [Thermoplasmatota archaeon]